MPGTLSSPVPTCGVRGPQRDEGTEALGSIPKASVDLPPPGDPHPPQAMPKVSLGHSGACRQLGGGGDYIPLSASETDISAHSKSFQQLSWHTALMT